MDFDAERDAMEKMQASSFRGKAGSIELLGALLAPRQEMPKLGLIDLS